MFPTFYIYYLQSRCSKFLYSYKINLKKQKQTKQHYKLKNKEVAQNLYFLTPIAMRLYIDEWLQELKVVTKYIYHNKQMQKLFLKIYVFLKFYCYTLIDFFLFFFFNFNNFVILWERVFKIYFLQTRKGQISGLKGFYYSYKFRIGDGRKRNLLLFYFGIYIWDGTHEGAVNYSNFGFMVFNLYFFQQSFQLKKLHSPYTLWLQPRGPWC